MPLLSLERLDETTLLGLWQVTEETDALKAQLTKLRPQHEISVFKAESRTREWLAARVLAYTLLAELTPDPVLLTNLESGQPVITGGAFQISLTHSGPWIAVLVSGSQQVGIDIELKKEKVPRLAFRFLSEPELTACAQDSDKMHLYWSAKETLYKLYSRRQLTFKEQLLLQDFEKQEKGQFKGQILTDEFNQQYDIHYQNTRDYVLTYVLASCEDI